jgi:integrase
VATIRRRGKKWQVQIRLRGQKQPSRTFTFKADAENWARQLEASIERGDLNGPAEIAGMTLNHLLDRYERTMTRAKKGADSEAYRLKVLRRHSIAALALNELTPSKICGYRDDRLKKVSPSSVRRELAVLQHCLEIARREWNIGLQGNPVAEITKPSENVARKRRITNDELQRLNESLGRSRHPMLANVVRFAMHAGMRRSEILSIRWADIDPEGHTVSLADTKNGYPRVVPLSPSGIAALPSRALGAADDARVFPMSANALRLAWERLKKRAGIRDLRFHDLRHEAISRFFELGLSIPEVSLISGHRDVRMLLRYTHLRPTDVAQKLSALSPNESAQVSKDTAHCEENNLTSRIV